MQTCDVFDHGRKKSVPAGSGERGRFDQDLRLRVNQKVQETARKVMQDGSLKVGGGPAFDDGVRVPREGKAERLHDA